MEKIILCFYSNKCEELVEKDFIVVKSDMSPLMNMCINDYETIGEIFEYVLTKLTSSEIKFKNNKEEDALYFACKSEYENSWKFIEKLLNYYNPFSEREYLKSLYFISKSESTKRLLFNFLGYDKTLSTITRCRKDIDNYDYHKLCKYTLEDFLLEDINNINQIEYVCSSLRRNSHRSLRYIINRFKNDINIQPYFHIVKKNFNNKNYIKLINIFKQYFSPEVKDLEIDYLLDKALKACFDNNVFCLNSLIKKKFIEKFDNKIIIFYIKYFPKSIEYIKNFDKDLFSDKIEKYLSKIKIKTINYDILKLLLSSSNNITTEALFYTEDVNIYKIFSEHLTYEQMCEKCFLSINCRFARNGDTDSLIKFLIEYYNTKEIDGEYFQDLYFSAKTNNQIEILKILMNKLNDEHSTLVYRAMLKDLCYSVKYDEEYSEDIVENLLLLILPYYSNDFLRSYLGNYKDDKEENYSLEYKIINDYLEFNSFVCK